MVADIRWHEKLFLILVLLNKMVLVPAAIIHGIAIWRGRRGGGTSRRAAASRGLAGNWGWRRVGTLTEGNFGLRISGILGMEPILKSVLKYSFAIQ